MEKNNYVIWSSLNDRGMSLEMLNEPVSKYANPELMVVEGDVTITDAAKMMIGSKTDSVLVFENNEVIGILTNQDIISDVVAKGLDPSKITVKDISHQPIIKIHKDSEVKEAIALMNKHDIRRLIVTDGKRTIGTISRKKIIGDLHDYSVVLPELDIPNKIRCPYCLSQFENKNILSKHIDDIHIGKGLFEGNLARREELGTLSSPDSYSKTL